MTEILSDSANRHRFVHEFNHNFSVHAPAGVGKTKAIVDRIVNIALNDSESEHTLLQRLVIVTYTKKAADEMQHRTRNAIMEKGVGPDVVNRLNQAYFGTIHSYCLELLRQQGSLLGLPATIEIAESEDLLWEQFIRSSDLLTAILPEEARLYFLRHTRLDSIFQLARKLKFPVEKGQEKKVPPQPELDFDPVFQCPPNKRSKGNVETGQEILRRWLEVEAGGDGYNPIPVYEKGGKDFQEIWSNSFILLRNWLGKTAIVLISHVSQEYLKFRIAQGLLTYGDLVELVLELLKDVQVGGEIRAEGKCVILDEAQDTDPSQFKVLTEIARPESAQGVWINGDDQPPEAGRFCMVGDPQQSIYGSRADLVVYQQLHQKFLKENAAEELIFEVTFRCAERIVDAVNLFFPQVLKGTGKIGEQVKFVPLKARPDAEKGQLFRAILDRPGEIEQSRRQGVVALSYATALANWLKRIKPEDLGARSWSDVAILCPRNEWLETLDVELKAAGFATQLLSRSDRMGNNPTYAWFTSLMAIISEPENAFEIAGVLREFFGISDHDLVAYYQFWKSHHEQYPPTTHALQILHPVEGDGCVAETLNLLARSRQKAMTMPLREAVAYLVDAVQLRHRLVMLPLSYPSETNTLLDHLIAQSAVAEGERMSLAEWTYSLVNGLDNQIDSGSLLPDHIQLLSTHKAKGLEWDAVLLPFFFRQINYAHGNYPRLNYEQGQKSLTVTLDKQHDTNTYREQLDKGQHQELDRLLYVAITRARQTLVLFNDESFFPPEKNSFGTRLKVNLNETNHEHWIALPTGLHTDTESEAGVDRDVVTENVDEKKISPFDSTILKSARRHGLGKFKHATPHTLAMRVKDLPTERDEPEQLLGHAFPDESSNTAATEYGSWWHEMMEENAWDKNMENWKSHCASKAQSPTCPDPHRGREEIELFFYSQLTAQLTAHDYRIQTEVPFLWRDDEDSVFEGLIDFVAYDHTLKQWMVIDWKTHQATAQNFTADLVKQYTPQLSAYANALHGISGEPVKTYLYSTALGQLLAIEDS